ncbi:MAG: hypothetical protein ACXW4I_07380, partial [Candidatus Deferrimicrobiaceae bacterium]
TRYSVAIGQEMGLSPDHLRELRRAASLHDLGKIGVRDAIPVRNDPFTEEWREEEFSSEDPLPVGET